jgi:hypothetical protein
MRTQFRSIALSLAVATVCSTCALARAEDSNARVGTSLSSLEKWLGRGENGKTWSSYLKLSELKAELAKGDKADQANVAAALKRLEGGAAGLELAPFAELREAVGQWNDELAIAKAPDLAQVASDAEAAFHPATDADAIRAKAELAAAAGRLDRYLKPLGANGTAWKTFLRWKDLQEQLQSTSPAVDTLKSVHQQLIADQNGLEMPVFFEVADTLERYINVLSARQEDQKTQYQAQVKALAEELKQYTTAYADETAFSLGERLGWLENARQAIPLVRAIRQRFSHPNLHVKLSSRLVAAGIERPLDEITPVRDVILGTDITGTGRTVGKITMELVPNPDKGVFETVLVGKVRTRTVGRNGPATIYSNSTTDISGRKRIVLDDKGLASYPAKATASTATQISGIAAGRSGSGIVQKIATRKVYQSKSEAERIGSDHAAARVRKRVEEEAAVQLGKAHWNYLTKVRNPLLRRREFPALLKFSTTQESMFVTAMQANRHQLAAPDNPPSVTVENDIAVQLHESLANNFAAALLSGLTLTEADAQKQAIDLLGKLPEQLKSEQDRDPWSITFAKTRPLTIKFADNGFQVTIRGQRYTSGDRDFQAMNVTAEYKIESQGDRFRLVRKNELQIEPPNFVKGKTLSGRQIALKTLLEKRFGKIFEPEIKSEGLILPGRWRAAGRLDPKQLQSSGGWLVVAWIESGVPAPPEDKVVQQEKVAQAD